MYDLSCQMSIAFLLNLRHVSSYISTPATNSSYSIPQTIDNKTPSLTLKSAKCRSHMNSPPTLERKLYYTVWPELQHGDIWLWNNGGIMVGEINPLSPELNPICYLLALLGAHHFLHVSRIRVKSLTLRLLMSYIYIYIWH